MLDVAGALCSRGPEEFLNHVPAGQDRMPVLTAEFRHNGPGLMRALNEALDQFDKSCLLRGRPVNERDHGIVAAAIQRFSKSGLK